MEIDPAWFWLAGLYEGEGSLVSTCGRGRLAGITRGWILSISGRDEDVIRRAHAVAGVGIVRPEKDAGTRPFWRWNVCAMDDLAIVVPRLLPHLGLRRAEKAREYLVWQAQRDLEPGRNRGHAKVRL